MTEPPHTIFKVIGTRYSINITIEMSMIGKICSDILEQAKASGLYDTDQGVNANCSEMMNAAARTMELASIVLHSIEAPPAKSDHRD